jgi:hypothetical protein
MPARPPFSSNPYPLPNPHFRVMSWQRVREAGWPSMSNGLRNTTHRRCARRPPDRIRWPRRSRPQPFGRAHPWITDRSDGVVHPKARLSTRTSRQPLPCLLATPSSPPTPKNERHPRPRRSTPGTRRVARPGPTPSEVRVLRQRREPVIPPEKIFDGLRSAPASAPFLSRRETPAQHASEPSACGARASSRPRPLLPALTVRRHAGSIRHGTSAIMRAPKPRPAPTQGWTLVLSAPGRRSAAKP